MNFYSVLPRLRFCAIVAQFLKMMQPKLSLGDIWRTLIFGLAQGLNPKAVWKIPMPKITLFFTRISIVVMAVLIGVLDF